MMRAVRARTEEFFFLREAGRKSAALAPSQRRSVREYFDAAERRVSVARRLRDPEDRSVALSLYQRAAVFLGHAVLLERHEAAEVRDLSAAATFERIDETLRSGQVEPPMSYARARPLLASSDPLVCDRLGPEHAPRALQDLASAVRWMLTLVEARSDRELTFVRTVRQALAVSVVLVLAGWLAFRLAAPKDIALGKRASSSSVAWGTTPAGAVDGVMNGRYGFHSAEEDSPWLSIDLGATYRIGTVKVHGRGDCCFDQSIPLALEASDDGRIFTKIAERTDKFSESDPWVVKPIRLDSRFVRLRTERRAFLVLSEVEVFGRLRK